MADNQQTLFSTPQTEMTSDDYYTPAWIFETLGLTFDLDVASPPGGIPWIPAKRYFTMSDDGLSQPWEGLIWMNPPYSKPKEWVRRFIEHNNGVALLPTTKSKWFTTLWTNPKTQCVQVSSNLSGDLEFVRKNAEKHIMFPILAWAMGDEAIEALHKLGRVR
jgi:hypothetical protein